MAASGSGKPSSGFPGNGSTELPEKKQAKNSRHRVAFQGETGAYSQQAIFELLGKEQIETVAHASFELAFSATTDGHVDFLMVPIENTLGGTIHANFDLQIQHNLFIVAEHDFRVRHCLVALPGTKKENLSKIISHPQGLAQCDSYIKNLGVSSEAAYDTAGSAKLIAEGKLESVAAICSELAATSYGLEVLESGIEDDPHNFTRFLLLRNSPVRVAASTPCKTSIAFSLEDSTGALFKALSVFALRDISLSKIESRPCKPDVMKRLQRLFWSVSGSWDAVQVAKSSGDFKDSRAGYPYIFYADFLASLDEPNVTNALRHLQELTTFVRVLGCYPRGGTVAGIDNLGLNMHIPRSTLGTPPKRRLAILGFGNFGQFMAKKFILDFDVFAWSRSDQSSAARGLGVTWFPTIEELLAQRIDILIISVSILSFESVMRNMVSAMSSPEGSISKGALVVDVLSVKVHAKTTMLALLPETCDILCTHPMFGPESGKHGWNGLPFVFDRVRLKDARRCEDFVKWWSSQGCRMVDMTCELHDEVAASSQFVTHFTGRVLQRLNLRTTPINTKGFESLLTLVENTCKDSFDLFSALFKYNPNSNQELQAVEEAIVSVSKQLRGKD